MLADRIEAIVAETSQTGFHFVDRPRRPQLKRWPTALIARNAASAGGAMCGSRRPSPQLAELMAESGCIAISGGLEVASDRLLQLMKKGVSVDQVARVTAFTDTGHFGARLPDVRVSTQTVQDTVDALEYVRQLFANGCIQSGFFTVPHAPCISPVAKPGGIWRATGPAAGRLCEETTWPSSTPPAWTTTPSGGGLKKAIYNYMHGIGAEEDAQLVLQGALRPRYSATGLSGRCASAVEAGHDCGQERLIALSSVENGGNEHTRLHLPHRALLVLRPLVCPCSGRLCSAPPGDPSAPRFLRGRCCRAARHALYRWVAISSASARAAGITEANTLHQAFDKVQLVPQVIASDKAQPEFTHRLGLPRQHRLAPARQPWPDPVAQPAAGSGHRACALWRPAGNCGRHLGA